MEVTDVKVVFYKKHSHVQIYVDQQLVLTPEVIYFHKYDITEDFRSVWLDDIDLLSFCSVYDIASVIAEPDKLIIAANNDLDWDEFTDDLLYLIHNVSPNANVSLIDGGELFVVETADFFITDSIYELVS